MPRLRRATGLVVRCRARLRRDVLGQLLLVVVELARLFQALLEVFDALAQALADVRALNAELLYEETSLQRRRRLIESRAVAQEDLEAKAQRVERLRQMYAPAPQIFRMCHIE